MNKLFSFSLYDVGNSVFPMIVIASVTSSYFVNNVADDQQNGTALWQLTIGIVGIIVAIVMPYLGKIADSKENGKIFYLRVFSLICIISISCFWFIKPSSSYTFNALIILLIAGMTYEISNSFYNSTLKNCYPSNITLGSGIGFGSGFIGGVVLFFILLQLLILPEKNIFNLNTENYDHIRFIHVILALWFLLFSIPLIFVSNIKHPARQYKKSTYEEIKSRHASIVFITDKPQQNKENVIYIPNNETFANLLCIIPMQLLAYHLSVSKNINPDMPRNLAKVVTVE